MEMVLGDQITMRGSGPCSGGRLGPEGSGNGVTVTFQSCVIIDAKRR